MNYASASEPPLSSFEHQGLVVQNQPRTQNIFSILTRPDPAAPVSGTRNAIILLGGSFALALASNRLLSESTVGINVGIFASLLAGFVLLLSRISRCGCGRGRGLLIPAVVFAGVAAWRDSPFLLALNLGLSAFFFALAAAYSRDSGLANSALTSYPVRLVQSAVNAVFGCPRYLFGEVKWREFRHLTFSQKVVSVFRGLLLALPLLIIFGALFRSADARFELIVSHALAWLPPLSIFHLAWVCVASWLLAGFLRQYLFVEPVRYSAAAAPRASFQIGTIEIVIVLCCLNALFLGFVLTQLPYFFGGGEHVLNTANLTLANYARRGFFELVTVAALLLPVLLCLDWMLKKGSAREQIIVRALSAGLIALLFVVMGSAVKKMLLYTNTFGLTELRLYVTAFIGFLALVFLWFCATVLPGRREQFAFGAIVIGALSAFAVQAINPDALIARTNLTRAASGQRVDLAYLLSLGADTVPVITAKRDSVSAEMREQLDAAVRLKAIAYAARDWRAWNYARWRAVREAKARVRADG